MQRGRAVLAIVASALGGFALAVGCGLNAVGGLTSSGGLSDAGPEAGTLDGSSSSSSSGGPTDGAVDADAGEEDSGIVFLGDAGGRTTRGLVALYPMRETTGLIVHDTETAPLHLGRIATASEMKWDPLGLTFFGNGSEVSSPVALPTKITPACKTSNEASAEAWVTPSAAGQSGPARILSLSNGIATQSIMLGIGDDGSVSNVRAAWVARLQNGGTRSIFETNDGAVAAVLHHVVVTAKTGSPLKLYIDNVEATNTRGNVTVDNDFSDWISSNSFRLGGELGTLDRRFKGTLSLVAIYCVELTPTEIDANFRAGARP